MKDEVIEQDVQMNAQLIEKEYINSMLNIVPSDTGAESFNRQNVHLDIIADKDSNKDLDIECEVISIAGLNLALRSSNIKGALSQQKVLHADAENVKPGMCVGRIYYVDKNIDVIDLTFHIMNGVNSNYYKDKYEGELVNILLMNEYSLGIIFDEVVRAQTISYKDVCWRDESSDRLWLAGTVKQYGFSLLDMDGIINLINEES